LSRVLRENKDAVLDKWEILFEALGYPREGLSRENCADKFIEAVDEWIKKLEIPTDLKSMGIEHKVLPEIVTDALKDPPLLANPKKFDSDKIKQLLIQTR
jgi:alcohol dehydrogenase class IV